MFRLTMPECSAKLLFMVLFNGKQPVALSEEDEALDHRDDVYRYFVREAFCPGALGIVQGYYVIPRVVKGGA